MFHIELNTRPFTFHDNTRMLDVWKPAIRGVKCIIRSGRCSSFWHIDHLWWMEPVAPSSDTRGCVCGRRRAHPLRCFSPLLTIWGGKFGIPQTDSTLVVVLSIFQEFSLHPDRNPLFAQAVIRAHNALDCIFPPRFLFLFCIVIPSVKLELKMPRSFLVKKYFPYKKQHNRERYPESHTGKFAIVRDCMQDICECIRYIGNHSHELPIKLPADT